MLNTQKLNDPKLGIVPKINNAYLPNRENIDAVVTAQILSSTKGSRGREIKVNLIDLRKGRDPDMPVTSAELESGTVGSYPWVNTFVSCI